MDLDTTVAEFEATITTQARLGGEVLDETAEALLAATRPAVERMAMRLAEQAAVEVSVQLPDASVEVVISDGEPTMAVRANPESETKRLSGDELEARLTLRLPSDLKSLVEDRAAEKGESVNSYVLHALMNATRRRGGSAKRVKGTVTT